jgi:AcrR family transcriptional regulator
VTVLKSLPAAPAKAGRPLSIETGQAIVAASEALLVESGYSGLSIERVAQRAGVTRQTIYRRWTSKIDLVAAVLAQRDESEPEGIPDTGKVRDDLAVLAHRFAIRQRPGPPFLQSLVVEAQYDEKLAEIVDAYLGSRREQAGTVIRRARDRGELRTDIDVEALADLFYGFAWYRRLIKRTTIDDSGYARVIDTLLQSSWNSARKDDK